MMRSRIRLSLAIEILQKFGRAGATISNQLFKEMPPEDETFDRVKFIQELEKRIHLEDWPIMRTCLLLILLTFSATMSTAAQDGYLASALLKVSHDDSSVQDEFESYLARELRGLRDVNIVTKKAPGVFTVGVLMVDSTSGTVKRGYAASITITQYSRCNTMYKNTNGSPLVTYYDNLEDGMIYIFGTDRLKENAEKIIAQFDTRVLKEDREFYRLIHPKQ